MLVISVSAGRFCMHWFLQFSLVALSLDDLYRPLLHAAEADAPRLLPQRVLLLPCLEEEGGGGGGGDDDFFAVDSVFHVDTLDDPGFVGEGVDDIDWSDSLDYVFGEHESISDCPDWSLHRLFRQARRARRTADVADWAGDLHWMFDVPLLRRSMRLARKPRVDYSGMC